MVCQRYKQFDCRVNQPASSWVALSAKWMLIFSLSNSFVEICDCTPLYANSFDLNARHSQMSVAGIRCCSQVLRRCRSQVCSSILNNYVACSVLVLSDARFRICWTPVPVCLRRLYPYPCGRTLGGNFIMTCTVSTAFFTLRLSLEFH